VPQNLLYETLVAYFVLALIIIIELTKLEYADLSFEGIGELPVTTSSRIDLKAILHLAAMLSKPGRDRLAGTFGSLFSASAQRLIMLGSLEFLGSFPSNDCKKH